MAVRLAKSGYFGGDPSKVAAAPVSTVLAILAYESFERDYELAYHELNKDSDA